MRRYNVKRGTKETLLRNAGELLGALGIEVTDEQAAHVEKRQEYVKQKNALARARYKENPTPFLAAKRKYKLMHQEKIKEGARVYYAEHREEINARSREWQNANREKVRAQERERRKANRDERNAKRREKAAEKRAQARGGT